MLLCIYYECCNPPVQMPSSSMRRRRQHPPPPPLNCHDHRVLSSLRRCRNLVCPPVHPVAGSWTCSITTTAPTGRKGRVPPASCCSPPIVASSQSPPPLLSLCSRPVAIVTTIADASKRGPSLSCADAAPMSHAGAAPAASYKAEAKSKVEAEARLSVSQVDSEWAASSPRSCCRLGRPPSQTPRATGPGHRRHCGRGAHRGPPPSNSPTVIGLALE
jgi:hypothetical protein